MVAAVESAGDSPAGLHRSSSQDDCAPLEDYAVCRKCL